MIDKNPDGPAARLEAAARDEVLAYGVRRATATSIARRAGVSRMTVYRHSGGVQQLVLDALFAEFRRLAEGARTTATGAHAREIITTTCLESVRVLRDAELVRALRQHDPELLLPYVIDHFGRGQELLRELLVEAITEGQRDGSVRDVEPPLAALTLLLALESFVLSAAVVPQLADQGAVDAEVVELVDRYLSPEVGA